MFALWLIEFFKGKPVVDVADDFPVDQTPGAAPVGDGVAFSAPANRCDEGFLHNMQGVASLRVLAGQTTV